MDNLDMVKRGDLTALKRNTGGGLNLVSNAKNILNDMKDIANYGAGNARERLANDQARINQLKQQNQSFVKRETLPFDVDEAYNAKPGRAEQAAA